MKRQLTTFAFAGFLGICCIGCPANEEPAVDTSTETELNEGDIDTGSAEGESNTTAAEAAGDGIEMLTEGE